MSRAVVSEAPDLIVGVQAPTRALVYVVSERAGAFLSAATNQQVTKESTLEVYGNISEFIASMPDEFLVRYSHANSASAVLH